MRSFWGAGIAGFAHEWELYGENVLIDLQETLEEGRDVEALRPEAERIAKMPRGPEKEEAADVLFYQLREAPMREDYPYEEPSDLPSILKARPKDQPHLEKPAADAVLEDKLLGAWRGRVCGCLLGKPIEGMYQEQILRIARAEDNEPIRTYLGGDPEALRKAGIDEGSIRRLAVCYRPGSMPADDDTNYTVMACKEILGRFGSGFTPEDVAKVWLYSQPVTAYCTAERAAVKNFVDAIAPPDSAVYKNPFREWIGAQIRGDYFGYIHPGDPASAAEMAFRDASISHVKNGIYGEMLFAAAIAAAAVLEDPEEILLAGLSQIPEKSRLYKDVLQVIAWYREGLSAGEVMERIRSIWNEKDPHHWCHTDSNAMIVAACFLYGGLDYTRTVGIAVSFGFDTDCNAATVGSLVGMVRGSRAIDETWTSAVADTVQTALLGWNTVRIPDLVQDTIETIKKLESGQ